MCDIVWLTQLDISVREKCGYLGKVTRTVAKWVVLSAELSFIKLPFETNNEKFSLRRVKSKKICGHLGGNLLLTRSQTRQLVTSQIRKHFIIKRNNKSQKLLHSGESHYAISNSTIGVDYRLAVVAGQITAVRTPTRYGKPRSARFIRLDHHRIRVVGVRPCRTNTLQFHRVRKWSPRDGT